MLPCGLALLHTLELQALSLLLTLFWAPPFHAHFHQILSFLGISSYILFNSNPLAVQGQQTFVPSMAVARYTAGTSLMPGRLEFRAYSLVCNMVEEEGRLGAGSWGQGKTPRASQWENEWFKVCRAGAGCLLPFAPSPDTSSSPQAMT